MVHLSMKYCTIMYTKYMKGDYGYDRIISTR